MKKLVSTVLSSGIVEKAEKKLDDVLTLAVDKFTADDELSDEVKLEIKAALKDVTLQKNRIPKNLSYLSNVVKSSIPHSITDIKNIRSSISAKLAADAGHRLADRSK